MTPREAFAEFAEIERRFGTDDSPLFKVLHALIEQGERFEEILRAHDARLALLTGEDTQSPVQLVRRKPAKDSPASPQLEGGRDTLPTVPITRRRDP